MAFSQSQGVNPQNPYLLPSNFRLPRIFFSYQHHGHLTLGRFRASPAGQKRAFRCSACPTRPLCPPPLPRVALPSPVESLAASCNSRVPSGNLVKPHPSRALGFPQAAGLSSGVGGWREAGRQQPLTWLACSVLRIRGAIVSAILVSAPRHRPGSGKEP